MKAGRTVPRRERSLALLVVLLACGGILMALVVDALSEKAPGTPPRSPEATPKGPEQGTRPGHDVAPHAVTRAA